MKFLKILLTTLSLTVNANLPPTTIQGQNGTKSGFFNLQVPNNSITKLNSTTALLETGNDNLLENGSFEHPQATAIWSITGTPTLDTSNQVHGKQAVSISISSTTVATNSSTINAANLSGLQGVVSVYIKTSLTDAYVCSYINSAEVNCVLAVSNNRWVKIEIPSILGGTSNGIKVKTSSSTSGTILLDNAFVGTGSPFQNVTGAKLIGTLKYAGTANCIWSYSTTTWGNIPADTDCATPTVTGVLTAPGTKIPAFVLPAGSPAGTYSIVMNTMLYKATSNGFGVFRFSDGTNSSNGSGIYVNSQGSPNIVGNITYTSSLSAATTIQLQSKVSSGGIEVYGTDTTDGLSFEVYYYPPENKIYSQPNQDYDWTSYTPTFTGFGTVSSSDCYHKRKGSDLYVKCKWTAGTSTATEARLSLPSGLTSTAFASIRTAGVVTYGTVQSNLTLYALIEPSQTYFTFGYNSNSVSSLNKRNGSDFAPSGQVMSFDSGPIPIAGWSDYGVIVGSFKDYVSTPTGGRVETFSFSYGDTSTTSCSTATCAYLDQIGNLITSVTRSSAGNYTINFSKTYAKAKCLYSPTSSAATNMSLNNSRMSCENCSALSYTTVNGSGTATNAHGTLYCQGQL